MNQLRIGINIRWAWEGKMRETSPDEQAQLHGFPELGHVCGIYCFMCQEYVAFDLGACL